METDRLVHRQATVGMKNKAFTSVCDFFITSRKDAGYEQVFVV